MSGFTDQYKIENELNLLGFFENEINGDPIYHTIKTTSDGYMPYIYKWWLNGAVKCELTIILRDGSPT